MRIATLSLLVLCLALGAAAQTTIYSEGPIDGTTNSFFVTGPSLPNFLGTFQDISNGFVAANTAAAASNDGTQGWDIPGYPVGGPATCNFRQSGTNFGGCGVGGESFTLSGGTVPPPSTPEPSSIMLFGSGILGLAGILRRKMTR